MYHAFLLFWYALYHPNEAVNVEFHMRYDH